MLSNITRRIKFLKNRNLLYTAAESFVDFFESEIKKKDYCDSCKTELLKEIKRYFDSDYVGISLLNPNHDNFNKIAVATISTVAFEFFEYGYYRIGGKYHIFHYGSVMMRHMHFKALQWGFDQGYVTQEEMDEDKLAFEDTFRQVF